MKTEMLKGYLSGWSVANKVVTQHPYPDIIASLYKSNLDILGRNDFDSMRVMSDWWHGHVIGLLHGYESSGAIK